MTLSFLLSLAAMKPRRAAPPVAHYTIRSQNIRGQANNPAQQLLVLCVCPFVYLSIHLSVPTTTDCVAGQL